MPLFCAANGWKAARLIAGVLAGWAGIAHADETETPEGKEIRLLLDRWLEVQGGARNLARLRSVDYQCTIDFGGNLPPIETEIRADLSGGYRYDYELPKYGRLTQAFNGRVTWQRNSVLGFGQLTEPEHISNLVGADVRRPVRDATRALHDARLLADETVAGRRLRVLELGETSEQRERWYYDALTGQRVKQEIATPVGPLVVTYSDFQPALGSPIVDAHRVERLVNGQKSVTLLKQVSYNDDVDFELFGAPQACLEDNQEIERLLFAYRQVCGEGQLEQVATRITKEIVEVTTSGLRIATKTSQKRPNLILVEQEIPGMGPSQRGFDGKIGWETSELQGYRVIRGPELMQLLALADLESPLRLSASCRLRRLLEEKYENGHRIVGVALATFTGPAGTFYFDADSHELVRLETLVPTGPSGEMKIVADFSDFRPVDGMMIPFTRIFTNPAVRMVTTVQSVQDNVPLDDAIFVARPDP